MQRRFFAAWIIVVLAGTLLFASVAGAQEEDAPTAQQDQYAPGPDEECPGAEVVSTTTSEGSTQTAPFQITGERFRVNIALASADPQFSFVDVTVLRAENDGFVTTVSKDGPGTKSSIVNAGPGRFYLDIFGSFGDPYVVTVEDCPGTAGDEEQPPELEEPPPDEKILNIPKKDLPRTGGPPLLLVGAALLSLASAAVAVRILRT